MPALAVGPKTKLIRDNVRTVKELYPHVTNSQMLVLRDMTRTLHLSVRVGDLLMLDGNGTSRTPACCDWLEDGGVPA